MLFVDDAGVGSRPPWKPEGYTYQQFSSSDDLLNAVALFPNSYDALPAYLHPRGCPFFQVTFGWARTYYHELFPFSKYGLSVISESRDVAIVSDHESGYLNGVVTDDEVIYQLAYWFPNVDA